MVDRHALEAPAARSPRVISRPPLQPATEPAGALEYLPAETKGTKKETINAPDARC